MKSYYKKYFIMLACLFLMGCASKQNSDNEIVSDSVQTQVIQKEDESEHESIQDFQEEEIKKEDISSNEADTEVSEETETANEDTQYNEAISGSEEEQTQEAKQESESMETKIVVYKADRRLELWENGQLTNAYSIGLGKNAEGRKEKEGDLKTPEGEYYVCTRNQYSKFYLALGVSYPNIEDAQYGLENGIIDEQTYNSIETAIQNGQCPPWDTALGGEIMIHGHGGSKDWTKGCIAVDDEVMDVLWETCTVGTKIFINP